MIKRKSSYWEAGGLIDELVTELYSDRFGRQRRKSPNIFWSLGSEEIWVLHCYLWTWISYLASLIFTCHFCKIGKIMCTSEIIMRMSEIININIKSMWHIVVTIMFYFFSLFKLILQKYAYYLIFHLSYLILSVDGLRRKRGSWHMAMWLSFGPLCSFYPVGSHSLLLPSSQWFYKKHLKWSRPPTVFNQSCRTACSWKSIRRVARYDNTEC